MAASIFTFGKKIDDVFGAAIELGVSLLPTEAFHFRDGNALDANRRERLADLVELEWLDDGGNEFHKFPECVSRSVRTSS
jgi:hypothetical protein